MNIRKTLIIFFIIICSFSIATITMAFKLKNTLDDVEKAQTNRHQSLQLADELRQSSDDLTRFARTYVTTGDKKYKKYFQQVLDIRNGILSRPDDYQNVYWDLVIANKLDQPSTDGVNKQPLETNMINAGFTMSEFNELRKAQGKSDKLVSLENIAMNAIEGKFDDGSGDFNIMKQPDREMAIRLMHGQQYHIEKASIMEPIKTFIHLVDKRTEKKLTELNKLAQKLVLLIVISGVSLIITLILMIWILNKRILNRAQKLLNTSIKILDGDLNARSNIKGADELGSVGKTFDTMIEKLSNAIIEAEEKTRNESERNKQLQIEQTRSEDLLNNILPKKISSRLKKGETTIAETYPEVSVLFADLVGFTELSEQVGPRELVGMLNRIFGIFDTLAKEMKLEKIKTIGDAYMIVGGIPERDPLHCQRIAEFAIEGLKQFKEFTKTFDHPLEIRIGIHTGTVVAGVVGIHKFTFDLWGDVVNVASRIESHAKPNTIQVSNAVKVRLIDDFDFVDNGELDIRGKGKVKAWDLINRKPNTEQLYVPNKHIESTEESDMSTSIDTLRKNYSSNDTVKENDNAIKNTNEN